MDLKPTIWISSTNHLEAFDSILKADHSWKKYFGFHNVPDNFPFMKQLGAKIPTVYFSKGEVAFKDGELRYNSFKTQDNYLNSYCNLNDNLSFVLNRPSIKSVGWCLYEKKSLGKFKWNWIRITCNEDVLDGDFLICADGVTNTKKLFEMLNQFKENHAVSTSLIDLSGSKMPILGYISLIIFFIAVISNLIVTAMYGTLNGNIGGSVVVILLLFAMVLFFTSMTWYLTKIKENSKIRYHGQLFIWTFVAIILLNEIKNHFYS